MSSSRPSFPDLGVSLAFLKAKRNDPRMEEPMHELAKPGLDIEALDLPALRALAKELRVFSALEGGAEFAKYDDESAPHAPPAHALASGASGTTALASDPAVAALLAALSQRAGHTPAPPPPAP